MSKLVIKNYYDNLDLTKKYKMAGFDLDYTIIKTKSGNIFPKNKDDWLLLNDQIKPKLLELSNDLEYIIVIFSNQKGLNKLKLSVHDFEDKIDNIRKLLDINFIFLAALEDDIYRKPRIGMFDYLKSDLGIKINKQDSFYVGDMAGRKNDKYDTDLKFALNLEITFMTPEEYFLDNSNEEKKLSGYKLDNFSKNTKINIKLKEKNMIIISGYPGSGKSCLAKKFAGESNLFSKDYLGKQFYKKLEEAMVNNQPVVVEGLYVENNSRKELKNIALKYKYSTTYILVKTSYELAFHLNLFRSLYQNKNRVPEIVYIKYKKNFEYPKESDWNKIIEYHPHISKKINKYFLY